MLLAYTCGVQHINCVKLVLGGTGQAEPSMQQEPSPATAVF